MTGVLKFPGSPQFNIQNPQSIMFDNATRFFRTRPLLMKLILINVAVFILIRLLGIVAMIASFSIDPVIDFLALPSSLSALAVKPWTPVTYMFFHYDVFHILFNMLVLYSIGSIFLYRCSPRQLVALYIYGGLAGAVAFTGMAQITPSVGGYLLGASASVMAILTAVGVIMPDHEVSFMLIGRVKMKWIVLATIAMFALGLVGDNAGAHVAHLGGVIMGAAFGLSLNRGTDITAPFNRAVDSVTIFFDRILHPVAKPRRRFGKKTPRSGFSGSGFSSANTSSGSSRASGDQSSFGRPGQEASADSGATDADDRRQLDEILDKIKRSGYGALTPDERRRLFEVSSRIK